MTTYIVEGRCDCARLARCQLLSDRVPTCIPSVRIQTEIFEPEEYKERLTSHARSFPNFHVAQDSQGPVVYTAEGYFIGDEHSLIHLLKEKYKVAEERLDLEGEEIQAALKRLVDANIKSLQKQKELKLKGPPILEEAEERTLSIINECSKPFDSKNNQKTGFTLIPDISVHQIIEGGSRFAFWSSAYLRKKRETNRNLQLRSEELSVDFLLNSSLPRGAPSSSSHFRLFLHDEPLCRNHLVLVPRDCMRQQHPGSKTKKTFIALVVDPDFDGILPQIAKKCRENLKATWIFKDLLLEENNEDGVYRLQPEEYANKLPSLLKNAAHKCIILAGAPSSVEESLALDSAGTSPDVCFILGNIFSFSEERKKAVESLCCETHEIALNPKEKDASKVADILIKNLETFLETKKKKTEKVRIIRRTSKRNSPSLEGFDWAGVTEILENISGLLTFQFFPGNYNQSDHRRPIDTHLQVFPFPIPPVGKESPFQKFPFEHFVKDALQRKTVYIPQLPFVHALIRVLPEAPLAACLEKIQFGETEDEPGMATSYVQAYHQAVEILRDLPSVSLDLNISAQSLILGPSFLLLIPHPPVSISGEKGFLITNAFNEGLKGDSFWRQWPPPHPLAFVGGSVGFSQLQKAWMDEEDPRRAQVIAFQPLGIQIDEREKEKEKEEERLAMNDEAWMRPMRLLAASCFPWKCLSPLEEQTQREEETTHALL